MNDRINSKNLSYERYIQELTTELEDTVHKRIIQSYKGDDPFHSMESELGKILLEILNRED